MLRVCPESVQEAVVKVCLLNTSLSLAGLKGRDEEGNPTLPTHSEGESLREGGCWALLSYARRPAPRGE